MRGAAVRSFRRLARYVAIAVLAVLLVLAAGVAATQTPWFKNWLRQQAISQAARYLNGELTIQRLEGTIFTGIALRGVELRHEGQTPVVIDRLTVAYSPLTMMSEGLIINSLTLDTPTILLQRDQDGWNFSRFVRRRTSTGGGGAPPLTMSAIAINNGHLIVKDGDRVVEDLTGLDTQFRFAYEKPGIAVSIRRFSARAAATNVQSITGDLRFQSGAIDARGFAIRTDGSDLVATLRYDGPADRALDIELNAERLSLPEVGHYFRPLAGIGLAPALDVRGNGTLDALRLDVDVVSSAGSARGPLVGHFGSGPKSLEGRLAVRDVNMAPILNRDQWQTRVTGEADFNWRFTPAQISFAFTGPSVEGFDYRAANVRARGIYESGRLSFDAEGAAYGALATTRAAFNFATERRPLAYTLAGAFRALDMRRLPEKLSMPKLETAAAGTYRFDAAGSNWRGSATLADSLVEGAHFASGTDLAIESRNRLMSYSAAGNVTQLNPRRFSRPLDVQWLDDARLSGSLTGSFTFEGSGRTVDELTLRTSAVLSDSALADARFPRAAVEFEMADRQMQAHFTGPFEQVHGASFFDRKELADTVLSGSADMNVSLDVPEEGPVRLLEIAGTAALAVSTIGGVAIERGRIEGAFADGTATFRELTLSGPDLEAMASGVLATGSSGDTALSYDVAMTNLAPVAERFNQPLAGAARIVGEAAGPAANLTLTGTLGVNRFQYGKNLDVLAANAKYVARLPDFDLERGRVQADTTATFVGLAGRSLPRITAQTVYERDQLQFQTRFEEDRRTLGLEGNVVFHPDHDEVHLRTLNLAAGAAQFSLPPGQEATARYSQQAIVIDNFVLERGSQHVAIAGTVAIGEGSENLTNTLNARFENVQLADINALLLGERPITGLLNATAVIRGTRNEPIVQSDFAITQGAVEGVAFNGLTGRADYFGRAIDLDVRLEQSPAAVLTAIGTVPVPNGPGIRSRAEEFDLALKSSLVDLALFQPATSQLTNLRGQLTADVHLAGTFDSPRLNGIVETTNGAFTVAATGVAYTGGIARFLFEGDRLLVDRFELADNERDRLVAIGQLGIIRRTVGAMNMQIAADGFKVLDNQYGTLEIETDLRVTGDATKPQVSGQIVTEGGRIEVDQLLDELARSPYRTEATVATTTTDDAGAIEEVERPVVAVDLWDAATVDINLRLPDDLLLRGRDMHASFSRVGLGDMNITVGGNLQIRKTPSGAPDVVGTVSVVRGFYDFQGRRFEVLRDSEIRFQGTRPIDPALQVEAQRVISGVTAIVNIRGSARHPQVRLSSQPPLDEADVLSLIVFNQPINQLGEGERMNLAERAGGLAAGYLASPLANSIARALDLDIFEIRAGGGENGQPSIAVGQQFGSRLFVSFEREFGSQDYSQLSLEYRINELLRLVSSVTQGAQRSHRMQRLDTTGVDLIYTISY